jgi:hypothetical protein
MTPSMVDLLKRLVTNERRFLLRMEKYQSTKHIMDYPDNTMRGEEIGWINGINPRTVTALENMGLVETIDMGNGIGYVFLGSYRWNKNPEELFK